MNYRSSNPEGYVHFGGDVMSGANSTAGVHLSSNTIQPASDSDNASLVVKGKGTGGVFIGNSTAATKGVWAGTATAPTVALPASAIVNSTITIPGVVAGDALFIGRASAQMSTALGIVGSWVSGTDEGSFSVINNVASTQSVVAGSFPYIVVKA